MIHFTDSNLLKLAIAHGPMGFELVGSEESNATFCTLVKSQVEVSPLMVFLVAFGGEFLGAESALELLITGMKLDMVNQTAFVLEKLATNFEWALVLIRIIQQLKWIITFLNLELDGTITVLSSHIANLLKATKYYYNFIINRTYLLTLL